MNLKGLPHFFFQAAFWYMLRDAWLVHFSLTWYQRGPASRCKYQRQGRWCWWGGSAWGRHAADTDLGTGSAEWRWSLQTPSGSANKRTTTYRQERLLWRLILHRSVSETEAVKSSMGASQRFKGGCNSSKSPLGGETLRGSAEVPVSPGGCTGTREGRLSRSTPTCWCLLQWTCLLPALVWSPADHSSGPRASFIRESHSQCKTKFAPVKWTSWFMFRNSNAEMLFKSVKIN